MIFDFHLFRSKQRIKRKEMDPFDYRESRPGNAVQYLLHDHEWFKLMINAVRQSQSFDQRRLLMDKLLKVSCQHEEIGT